MYNLHQKEGKKYKNDIEEIAKGQKGLKWPPYIKPKLHIYNTNTTSTKQIKDLHCKHGQKLTNFCHIQLFDLIWIHFRSFNIFAVFNFGNFTSSFLLLLNHNWFSCACHSIPWLLHTNYIKMTGSYHVFEKTVDCNNFGNTKNYIQISDYIFKQFQG